MARSKSSKAPERDATALAAKQNRAKAAKAKKPVLVRDGGVAVWRRHKPGVVALAQIKKQQKSKKMGMRRAPFMRYVKELSREFAGHALKFTDEAKTVLQRVCEQKFIECMRNSNKLAAHRGAPMLTARDVAQYEELVGSVDVADRIRSALCAEQPLLLACQQRSQKARQRKVVQNGPAAAAAGGEAEPEEA
jgi:histone H3/H4